MAFKDFVQGQTPEQAQYLRQQEEANRLDALFQSDELYLKILRPVETNPIPRRYLFEKWKDSQNKSVYREHEDWWKARFPESVSCYGPAFISRVPNIDMLAASLGESPAGVVYSSSQAGFFFNDYSVNAYRPVSEGRLCALVRRIALEACGNASRPGGEMLLEIRVLSEAVVATAKTILEVEGNFFKGQGGHRRYLEGGYIEPVETPLCRKFLDEQIVRVDRSVLKLGDAYHRYYEFCSNHSVDALPKHSFRKSFNHETKSRFGVGIRNDLRSSTGGMFQGWEGLEFANVLNGKN
jgi:hypothetical protein